MKIMELVVQLNEIKIKKINQICGPDDTARRQIQPSTARPDGSDGE
jgi:predicted NodU family carbamoyl transferase